MNCSILFKAPHPNPPRSRGGKRAAFTLAEVLITLGIIGVVAAMTIPNLMTKWQEKRTVSLLTETHSILAQAFRLAEEEYGEAAGWGLAFDTDSSTLVFNNLKPFIKVATDCGNVDTKENCFPNQKYKGLNNTELYNYAISYRTYKFRLMNGVSIDIETRTPASRVYMMLHVDINGAAPPNVIGKDFFEFNYILPNNTLVPSGSPQYSNNYKESCVKTADGYGCAYYVLQFKNMDYLHK